MAALANYFLEYGPSRFVKPNGRPVGKRQLQINAKELRLPILRIGWTTLIDPDAGDDRLRELARQPEPPRGPGRPRKG